MTNVEIENARLWLEANKDAITRIRPRLAGSIVRYIPRKGWGPGLSGVVDGAPAMWARLDEADDPMDSLFRKLGIAVDAPL